MANFIFLALTLSLSTFACGELEQAKPGNIHYAASKSKARNTIKQKATAALVGDQTIVRERTLNVNDWQQNNGQRVNDNVATGLSTNKNLNCIEIGSNVAFASENTRLEATFNFAFTDINMRDDQEITVTPEYFKHGAPRLTPLEMPINEELLRLQIVNNGKIISQETIYGDEVKTRFVTSDQVTNLKSDNMWGQSYTSARVYERARSIRLTETTPFNHKMTIDSSVSHENLSFRLCPVRPGVNVSWSSTALSLVK